jgi:TolB-like protein
MARQYPERYPAGARGLAAMADVFLSYKREDSAKVGKLAAALREAGLDVWWDRDIPPNANWEATIERALADAKSVIVCWSRDAVASDNVKSEARVARNSGRLIQIFLKPCTPPLFFGEQQGVDLNSWRGRADDPRIAAIAETVRRVAAGERVEGVAPARRRRVDRATWSVAALLLLLLAIGASWWFLRPSSDMRPKTLAVLPFRALNAADANLVDAIWDDTRGAIGRNPNLRVLGRQSIEALAKQDLQPQAYRKRVGADYLLDASVQHVGDDVQLKLSLVDTKDGSEVWSDEIGGKLDNVFAFQQRIASEVEGRIRGRVAPGGGTTARNIATSGAVYSLYAEARAKIRERRQLGSHAIPLLKKAVAMDPNFAPAWVDLAQLTVMVGDGGSPDDVQRKAAQYLNRALLLAPNLAHAYAVRGAFEKDNPTSERDLRRAVSLDPNDVEAWMWLGSYYAIRNQNMKALDAHSRAVELDPLWFNSMYNKMDDLARLGDMKGLAAELRRAERTGDQRLALLARQQFAFETGHPGTIAQLLYEFGQQFPDERHLYDLAAVLLQLGYVDEAGRIVQWPPEVISTYKGTPPSASWLKAQLSPRDFWEADDGLDAPASVMGRLLPNHRRLPEYLGFYRTAVHNADEFYELVNWPGGWARYFRIAPNAAANLRAAGETAQAAAIVQRQENMIEPLMRNGSPDRVMLVALAQLRSVEGRNDDAISALNAAVARGWLPNRVYYAADIAEEPSFRNLLGDARFQAIRSEIRRRLEDERRLITPQVLRSVNGTEGSAG